MQRDKARKETDELLKQTEKRLAKIYAEAQNDIAKKWDAYMEEAAKKIAPFEKAYQEAKEAGDQEAIRNLGITLSREKNKITTQSDYYKDMLDYTTEQLAHTNEKALDYVNNQMPRVYGINYNGTIDQIKTDAGRIGMGVSFNLLDERTIRNLVQTDKLDLPRKQLEKYKDKAWNAKAINSQMIQGILQGETIPEMAARLQNVTDMNEAAANRNARTMTTSAENSGRMDGMKAAEEKGLVYEKQWMATNDDRTRESHAEIDGESVPLDETFSNGLQYPGDPEGDPGEVYNCRCTMVRHLIGVRRRDGSIADIGEEEPELIFDLPETRQEREERLAREAEAAKATEPEETAEERPVTQGEDISKTWERRPDEFEFEIEDVINAQGFDGLPKVVSAEDFEKAVKEANEGKGFIAQRTYAAPDQETLDAYRDQLYNGKWYVDCSTGGAQYGQGMYCASDYSGNLTQGIKTEMEHYQELGENRNRVEYTPEDRYELALEKLPEEIANNPNAVGYLRGMAEGSFTEQAKYYSLIDKETESIIDKTFREIPTHREAVNYTETLTLDPSAKIIEFGDLREQERAFVENYYKEAIANALGDEATDLEQAMFRYVNAKDTKEDRDIISDFKFDNREAYDDMMEEKREEWKNLYREIADRGRMYERMNDGSFAAMLGYDAINAEGHGESGSYTVILNRTKVIFKGGRT